MTIDIPPAPPDRRRGVVGIACRDGRLLVVQRSAQVVAPGAWCFPGGHIEPGESEQAALLREFQEELSVLVCPLRRIWESVTPWGVTLAWWTVALAEECELRANLAEISVFQWCTPQEMADLPGLLPSNREFLERAVAGELNLSVERET